MEQKPRHQTKNAFKYIETILAYQGDQYGSILENIFHKTEDIESKWKLFQLLQKYIPNHIQAFQESYYNDIFEKQVKYLSKMIII
jgi:hypothetical protein